MTDQVQQREDLYQVWATETNTGQLVVVPMFPRVAKEAAEQFVETMQNMISTGKEKRYADPQALMHMPQFGIPH